MKTYIQRFKIKAFIISMLLFVFLLPAFVVAAEPGPLFPGEPSGKSADFRTYIQQFYTFAIPASVLVATVMIMIGGIIWITSAGDQGRVGKAKEFIIQPLIGVVLLMGAYVMLGYINPALVELKLPNLAEIGGGGACITKAEVRGGATAECTSNCVPAIDQADCNSVASEDNTHIFVANATCNEACKKLKAPTAARVCASYTSDYASSLGCDKSMDSCSVLCSNNGCEVGTLFLEQNGTKYACTCANKDTGRGLSTSCTVPGGACVKFPVDPDEYVNICNQTNTDKECRDQLVTNQKYWDYKFIAGQDCTQIDYSSMEGTSFSTN